jgi:hypothetical protein
MQDAEMDRCRLEARKDFCVEVVEGRGTSWIKVQDRGKRVHGMAILILCEADDRGCVYEHAR